MSKQYNLNEEEILERRKELCAKLKQMRLDKGLTLEQLAALTGMSLHNISRIENGKWNCGIDTLIVFSEALGFGIDFR